jgi:hypothetical protein
MHKHTHQAYNTMIKVEVKLLQLQFKVYKTLKQKVLQKIEHICGSVHLDDKGIHLALEVKTFLSNSTPTMGPSMESSHQKSRPPTDSSHWHHRKRERE